MVGQLRQPTPGKCIPSLLSMNPLSASINMYILLTVLRMFLFVLFERIGSSVKTFYKCWPYWGEVWRHVAMAARFLDFTNLSRQGRSFALLDDGRKVIWTTVLSPCAIKDRKIIPVNFSFFFPAMFARNFATLATWRDDFSLFLSFYIWSDSDAVRRNLILITIGVWKV